MSTAVRFDYDYVFDLATRLSPEEQGRLLRELPKPEGIRVNLIPEPETDSYSSEEFCEFLLRGPVIDESRIQLMLEAKEEVNKCRPISW